jgi:hypothetical protein
MSTEDDKIAARLRGFSILIFIFSVVSLACHCIGFDWVESFLVAVIMLAVMLWTATFLGD